MRHNGPFIDPIIKADFLEILTEVRFVRVADLCADSSEGKPDAVVSALTCEALPALLNDKYLLRFSLKWLARYALRRGASPL